MVRPLVRVSNKLKPRNRCETKLYQIGKPGGELLQVGIFRARVTKPTDRGNEKFR